MLKDWDLSELKRFKLLYHTEAKEKDSSLTAKSSFHDSSETEAHDLAKRYL